MPWCGEVSARRRIGDPGCRLLTGPGLGSYIAYLTP